MGARAEEDLPQFEGGDACEGEVDYGVESTLDETDSSLDRRVLADDRAVSRKGIPHVVKILCAVDLDKEDEIGQEMDYVTLTNR